MTIRFSLGSVSETKRNALLKALDLVGLPVDHASFLAAASGVNAQPFGHGEISRGAHNRAACARDSFPGSYGIGIENGIVRGTDDIVNDVDHWFDVAMVVVLHPDGREFARWSQAIEVPDEIVIGARSRGFETTTVGTVVAEKLGGTASDPHLTLTGGKTSREQLLVEAIVAALTEAKPSMQPEVEPITSPDG